MPAPARSDLHNHQLSPARQSGRDRNTAALGAGAPATLYHGARVWTGEPGGLQGAFAVTGAGEIAWVGGGLGEALAAGLAAVPERVDLGGAFIVPVRSL